MKITVKTRRLDFPDRGGYLNETFPDLVPDGAQILKTKMFADKYSLLVAVTYVEPKPEAKSA